MAIVQGAVVRGAIALRGNCPGFNDIGGATVLSGNCAGSNCSGGSYPGSNCPGGLLNSMSRISPSRKTLLSVSFRPFSVVRSKITNKRHYFLKEV